MEDLEEIRLLRELFHCSISEKKCKRRNYFIVVYPKRNVKFRPFMQSAFNAIFGKGREDRELRKTT